MFLLSRDVMLHLVTISLILHMDLKARRNNVNRESNRFRHPDQGNIVLFRQNWTIFVANDFLKAYNFHYLNFIILTTSLRNYSVHRQFTCIWWLAGFILSVSFKVICFMGEFNYYKIVRIVHMINSIYWSQSSNDRLVGCCHM